MADDIVSLVIPAHNEEETLASAVHEGMNRLEEIPAVNAELLIAEDGCTDDTARIARRLASEHETVTHLHFDDRLGRGDAIEAAFQEASGDMLAYMDADLSTDPAHLPELVAALQDGADIATGSRWIDGAVVERSVLRTVASAGYNRIVRLVFGSEVHDHQCGFKGFDADAARVLMERCDSDHWFWDTEILVRAQRQGYVVDEFPVRWTADGDSSVNLLRDTGRMAANIVSLFRSLRRESAP